MSNRPRRSLLLILLASFLLPGCAEEEISEYQVEKALPPYRLLAAIFPDTDRTWFIRMVGPRVEIGRSRATFDQFVESIRLTGKVDEPITWTRPSAWKKNDDLSVGGIRRYAAFRIGSQDDGVEVVITSLRGSGGSILANVNRYRGQLGLQPIGKVELSQTVEKQDVNGVEVTRIDLRGDKPTSSMPMPRRATRASSGGNQSNRARMRLIFDKNLPEGWTERATGREFHYAFAIKQGEDVASFSITPQVMVAQEAYQIINSWRQQLGLQPLGNGQTQDGVEFRKYASRDSWYAHIEEPQVGDRERKAIVGAVLPRRGLVWSFRLHGPTDIVAAQRANFDAFMDTVRFQPAVATSEGSDG